MPAFEFEKSTYSSGNGECVEVATNLIDTVAVRDSKVPEGPVLQFPAGPWADFLGQTKTR